MMAEAKIVVIVGIRIILDLPCANPADDAS
jgi:hypothetical protein